MKFLLSLISGIGSYIFFYRFIFHHVFLAILIGIVIFIAIWRLISLFQKIFIKKNPVETSASPSASSSSSPLLTPENNKIIEDGIKKLVKVRNLTRIIPNNVVAQKIQEICKTGMDIFDNMKKDPRDIRKARQFLNYYLDTTEKIVQQYAELSQRRDKTPEIEEALKRVEGVLDSIKETYQKQLASLMEDDILDLNVEISVLEKTIKLEG